MEVKEGQLYKHSKGNLYRVLHIALNANDAKQSLVVYQRADDKTLPVWVRSLTEFSDGRFELVKDIESLKSDMRVYRRLTEYPLFPAIKDIFKVGIF